MKKIFFDFKSILLYALLLFTNFSASYAAEMLLTGVYQGSNVFVINPKTSKGEFCVTEVYVNNKKIDVKISEYMELNLSHLKAKEAVTIKILHHDDCSPTIKNIHAIKAKETFQFTAVEFKPTGLAWLTKGEKKFGQFFIEVQKNNIWTVEKTINGKGQVLDNSYEYPITNTQGIVAYRIKYLEASGKITYSDEIPVTKAEQK
jgi:hypothetical protein